MKRKPAPFNRIAAVRATGNAVSHVSHYVEMAKKLTEDPDKKRRLEYQRCCSCHYIPRMAGAAMTSQPCACCGKDQMNGSTNTAALCPECAKKHKLCMQCGGDIEMREGRRNWPEGPEYEQPAPASTSTVMLLPKRPT